MDHLMNPCKRQRDSGITLFTAHTTVENTHVNPFLVQAYGKSGQGMGLGDYQGRFGGGELEIRQIHKLY